MRDDAQHPGAERLEAFAGGELAAGDRVVVESHLVDCARCRGELDEWRELFAALEALPSFAPAAGFADRVMAGVDVPVPWGVRVAAWSDQAGTLARRGAAEVERLLPKTTRGWAIAASFLALPTLVLAGLLFWLLTRYYVPTHGLWVFVTERFGLVVATIADRAFSWLIGTELVGWVVTTLGAVVETQGAGGIGAIALALGVAMTASMWVLYTNLFRPMTRESNHVSYCF